ncbi:MAG: transposase [Sphingorhabdus sp.]
MPRIARIVVPGVAHHVTQRGNRRLPVFFNDGDRRAYLALIAEACTAQGTRCLAWCLMENHVHLILIPREEDGLRATLAEAHRRYTRRINQREGWTGYLFQGRFASYPMDDAHLMAAVRYVENNPVKASIVKHAEDWAWSSARAHISGKPDGLTALDFDFGGVGNWRAMLVDGLEAADRDARIEAVLRTGRPLGSDVWLGLLENQTGRILKTRPAGRKRA